MMRSLSSLFLAFATLGAFAAGAPSSSKRSTPYITVQNNCGYSLVVGESKNGDMYGTSVNVAAGGSHTFDLEPNWTGRVWGRQSCSGQECNFAGMWAPATLAEVYFQESAAGDYYDISLVDGYNEPMKLEPINPQISSGGDPHRCGAPECTQSPDCPPELVLKDDNGNTIGCESACSKFQTDQYCCTGQYGQGVCQPTNYSKIFKAACPDAYSYAYDDATSVYMCQADGYKVTFCP